MNTTFLNHSIKERRRTSIEEMIGSQYFRYLILFVVLPIIILALRKVIQDCCRRREPNNNMTGAIKKFWRRPKVNGIKSNLKKLSTRVLRTCIRSSESFDRESTAGIALMVDVNCPGRRENSTTVEKDSSGIDRYPEYKAGYPVKKLPFTQDQRKIKIDYSQLYGGTINQPIRRIRKWFQKKISNEYFISTEMITSRIEEV